MTTAQCLIRQNITSSSRQVWQQGTWQVRSQPPTRTSRSCTTRYTTVSKTTHYRKTFLSLMIVVIHVMCSFDNLPSSNYTCIHPTLKTHLKTTSNLTPPYCYDHMLTVWFSSSTYKIGPVLALKKIFCKPNGDLILPDLLFNEFPMTCTYHMQVWQK